jgi:hypothetical protein
MTVNHKKLGMCSSLGRQPDINGISPKLWHLSPILKTKQNKSGFDRSNTFLQITEATGVPKYAPCGVGEALGALALKSQLVSAGSTGFCSSKNTSEPAELSPCRPPMAVFCNFSQNKAEQLTGPCTVVTCSLYRPHFQRT